MTREEAKKVFEYLEERANTQEPCDDAIDREYLFKVLDDFCGHDRTATITLDTLADLVYDMPSVTQKSEKWIPVSERLPEDYELVLFSTKTDRVFEGRYFDDNTDRQWYSFRDECFAWNNVVTAWMPLPEPFEPQESEE